MALVGAGWADPASLLGPQSQGGLRLLLCSLGVTRSMVYRALLCGQWSETSPFLQLSVVPWGGSVVLEHQLQPPGTTKQV